MRGQVSAELIIVIAALLAVAIILVVQLQKTAQEGSRAVGNRTAQVIGQICELASCESDADCPSTMRCNPATKCCETP
ncbi:MAG: hypothetical protein QXH27_00685 [Candidatus Micrarchaeia archaeon]